MEALPYTVIGSQKQYKAYCEKLADLNKLGRKTRLELDTVDLLALLIRIWEQEQRPLSDSGPVEYLQSLITQNCLTASKLAADLGISRSLVSDILNYRRRMSREVIRKLAARFNVSQELLNKPYDLATVQAAKTPRLLEKKSTAPATGTRGRSDEPLIQLLRERSGKASIAKLKDGKKITIWNIMSGHRLMDPCSYLIVNVSPRVVDSECTTFFTSDIQDLTDAKSGQTVYVAEN